MVVAAAAEIRSWSGEAPRRLGCPRAVWSAQT